MSYGQYGWLSRQQFARTLQGQPFMPGSHRRQGKAPFEGPRNGNTTQRLEGIANDHRTVPGIEKSEMPGGMSWRGNHFEGADAISFMQQERRFRCADGIAAAQWYLWLRGVQALIAGQKTRVSLADSNLGMRQSSMQSVQRANMIDVGVGQHDAYNRQTQLLRRLYDLLCLAAHACVDQRKAIVLAHQVAIDETQAGQLKKVVAVSCHFHGLKYPFC